MDTLLHDANGHFTELQAHRRWLHSHAEVGFDLTETTAKVKTLLEEMGYTPQTCGKSGLIATIQGDTSGKTVLLRADMDALPLQEEAPLPYACRSGAMHACGHDMHTAMLLGAAKLLMARKSKLCGTVKLMFQPSEETFEGAQDMIANGALDAPKVDAAMMLHVIAATPFQTGTVIVSPAGISAPSADIFCIDVQGKSCHGSSPENGIDALTAAAHILIAMQELQARELPAGADAVITIGSLHGGAAPNVIADRATMKGSIRAYEETTRDMIKKRISDIAACVATAFRTTAKVTFTGGCPALKNDGELVKKAQIYAQKLLGNELVLSAADFGSYRRGGGSEDFAYVAQQVPSVMLALVAGTPADGYQFPQHHPKVQFDEKALPIGAALYANFALSYLQEAGERQS